VTFTPLNRGNFVQFKKLKKEIKMKTLIFLFVFSLSGFLYAQNTQITILHTGDSHSHLDAFGPKSANGKGTIGGIGKAATIIGTVKATEQNVVLLHSGDFSVGDFFFNKYFGVPEIQIMKQLGFDALTVGNHEFDLGPSTLYSVFQEGFSQGSFPVLSANLDMTGFPQLGQYVSPYIIKTISGVKVGIFGMTIPSPLSNPAPVIINENIPEITYATVAELQSQGANVIILLSHLGWAVDSALAANIPGINFIVGGHDHYVFNQPKSVTNPLNTQTLVMEAGDSYEYIGKLKFTYSNGSVIFNNYSLIHADANVPPAPDVQNVVNYLKQGIIATYGNVYSTVLGHANRDITAAPGNNPRFKDSPLGNLITDSYRNKTHSDIAITANGLISQKIYAGAINGADVFRAVAYGFDTTTGLDFNLVKMKIRGSELINGLEVGLSAIGISDDYFIQVSGIKFKFNPDNPVGSRVIIPSIRIDCERLNPVKKYTLTVNEGLYGILLMSGIQVQSVTYTGIPEFVALSNFISLLHHVNYRSEGRIKETLNNNDFIEDEAENTSSIKNYKLYDNYPNPFNPITNIEFQIPKDEFVTLVVYNILGQEVTKLTNDFLKEGFYTYTWNASNFSSGTYFYILKTNSYTETKKMVVIK
jgi:2',3'-cyclic-nucleotide 2'-phosphodiesterase (5'-nucleotidase family)